MNNYIRRLRSGTLFAGLLVGLVGGALALGGCAGDDGDPGPPGPAGPPGQGGAGAPKAGVYVSFSLGGGTPSKLAIVDDDLLRIERTGDADVVNVSGPTHKTYFFKGNIYTGGGGDVWGFDSDTFALVPRKDNPSFQANREGTIGQGQVNTKSGATLAALAKDLKAFVGRTQLTDAEAATVDICDVKAIGGAAVSGVTKAPADTIFHNMGYSPVGIETTPDGKMAVVGVRQGDHLLFLDTDPASSNFATPVRFVVQRRGLIKDKTNATVGMFASQYAGFGGTAPGNLNHARAGGATGGEADGETYVEPCDTSLIRSAAGQLWFWSPDVDGDTLTGVRVDTITSTNPTVVQVRTPVVDDAAATGANVAFDYAGPWMNTLFNREGGGEVLQSIEFQGENSEGIWDVTNSSEVFEVQRIVADLATIKAHAGGTIGTPGNAGQFTNGQVIGVNVDFTSTGGGPTSVNYTYNALAGDDGSGKSATNLTTAFLAKNTPTDPGPNFIVNGLAGRAGTSEANFASKSGSGSNTVAFSNELWLLTFLGASDIFQIVDLSSAPPWLIKENVNLPSAFSAVVSPNNRLYQLVGGDLQVIDMATRSLLTTVQIPFSAGTMTGGPVIGQYTP